MLALWICGPHAFLVRFAPIFGLNGYQLQELNVLNWNIRRLNDDSKCLAVRWKIKESCCSIFCIQETKLDVVTTSYLKKLAPNVSVALLLAPL